MVIIRNIFLFLLIFVVISAHAPAGEKEFTVAFYNVENLFDTVNDPLKDDENYLPTSKYHWDNIKYKQKLSRLGEVIKQLGDPDGPEIMGICEVENQQVLKDLLSSKDLKKSGYKFIHYESSDKRGIDVALIYKPKAVKIISSKPFSVNSLKDIKWHTRDVLLVSARIKSDTLIILVNHWPSRRGGQLESESKRITMAKMVKHIIDSIQKKSPQAKIMVMGDFNDDPENISIAKILNSQKLLPLKKGEFYNSFIAVKEEGKGTIKYKGKWNLFDQIMISGGLLNTKGLHYIDYSKGICNPDWLYYKKNTRYGPFRTYMGIKYLGGYSDHFPVYIKLGIGH
jgi:predicted extracellular nuclease